MFAPRSIKTRFEVVNMNESCIREAASRGVLYGVLSLALHPPNPELFARLSEETTRLALGEAACILEKSGRENGSQLSSCIHRWMERFDLLTSDRFDTLYGRIFGHTARGPVCAYETEYGQDGLFQQPQQLAKITGFYEAFGLRPRQAERERPDHISCELEFLEFLSLKEACALLRNDDSMLQETRKGICLFLQNHVGRFALAFARELKKCEPAEFFGSVADVLFALIHFECPRLSIEPGPALLSLRSTQEDNVPMACGSESDPIQIEK